MILFLLLQLLAAQPAGVPAAPPPPAPPPFPMVPPEMAEEPMRAKAKVERVEIAAVAKATSTIVAVVRGKLETPAARLGTPLQIVAGLTIEIDLPVYIPRPDPRSKPDAAKGGMPAFTCDIPIRTLGLVPGLYTLIVNGVKTTFEIPASSAP